MKPKQPLPPDLKVLRTKGSKQILAHILSPLEQTALRHHYQPFTYNFNGQRIYISRRMCRHLVNITTQKAEVLLCAVAEHKATINIPLKLREVFDDPRVVFSLKPRLRNTLCRLECYTLLSIMQKGRSYFADEQAFSRNAMKTLDALFEKYNCTNLFK